MTLPAVALFANAFAKAPRTVSLAAVLANITGGRYRLQVEALRDLRSTDPAAYSREKRKLPAFCVSGTAASRTEAGKHSCLLQVDLDALNGTLATVRQQMLADPHIAFGFVSPSGDGLKCGLRIDGTRHAESFAAAQTYFRERYGLAIDPAVKDRLRLCFISHDPDAWTNPAAVALPIKADGFAEFAQSGQSGRKVVGGQLPPSSSYSVSSVQLLGAAVKISLPTAPRRNHAGLFKLARALLTLGARHPLSATDRMTAFSDWHNQVKALGFLRHDRDHYQAEFMNALRDANHPLGESPTDAAWRESQAGPTPADADLFQDALSRHLVAFCMALERRSGGKPWFLSCRDAGRLTGAAHRTCSHRLAGFVAVGLLRIVESATRAKAARYQWLGANSRRAPAPSPTGQESGATPDANMEKLQTTSRPGPQSTGSFGATAM